MRFLSSKNDVHIRDAKLDDSETLSLLQWEHLQKYSSLDIPKTPESYRHAIGSSLLKGDRYLVAEDEAHEVIGFLEQKKQNPTHVKIGYPYVSFNHPKRKDVQFNLLNQTMHRLKDIGVKIITTEISNHIADAVDLYSSLGFDTSRIIFQSWEGPIEADYEREIEPYEIRRVKQKDLEITYRWISQQLDRLSPLNISKKKYHELLRAPKSVRDGWALATLNDRPVAFVSSLIDKSDDSILIFGPYCEEGHEQVRISLLNELLLYSQLKGYEQARILRIKPFSNDEQLFNIFNFQKMEEISLMVKYL